MTSWQDGGNEPIYVCENHVKQVGTPRERPSDVRLITAPVDETATAAVGTDDHIEADDQTGIVEIEPAASPPSTPAANLATVVIEGTTPDSSAPERSTPEPADGRSAEKSEDRAQVPEAAQLTKKAAASSEAATTPPETAAQQATPDSSVSSSGDSPAQATSAKPVEGRAQVPDAVDTKSEAAAPSKTRANRPDKKTGRATPAAPGRSSARDLTYGNASKAVVDEAIWNMPAGDHEAYRTALRQGKPAIEAAQTAGGQLAVVYRKIGDYTVKLEALLSGSKARIKVAEAIDKPLENAVLEIIGSDALSDGEKDAAVAQLGALQEWAKHGLDGDITPLGASRLMRGVGDRANWGTSTAVPETLKPAYRALYTTLQNAIRASAPEAQNLHDRLTNLYAAKSDLDPLTAKELHSAKA